MSNIMTILQYFGLSDSEAKVYLASLELGPATVQEVAVKSGVKRTTVYTLLDGLKQAGLISEFNKKTKTLLVAEDPARLDGLMKERHEKVQAALPELRSLYNALAEKPKVRFYEGKEGVRQVFQDTLETDKEILCLVGLQSEMQSIPDIVNRYVRDRVKKGIGIKVLAEKSKYSIRNKEAGAKELRELYFLPPDSLPINTEVNIYGNKVAYVVFKKEFFAIIIESAEIANTWRMVFGIIWKLCKK